MDVQYGARSVVETKHYTTAIIPLLYCNRDGFARPPVTSAVPRVLNSRGGFEGDGRFVVIVCTHEMMRCRDVVLSVTFGYWTSPLIAFDSDWVRGLCDVFFGFVGVIGFVNG